MSNATHTPTPWQFVEGADNVSRLVPAKRAYRHPNNDDALAGSIMSIDTPNALSFHVARIWGDVEGGLDQAKANAAHIVKCVNAHDELVRALGTLLRLEALRDDDDAELAAAREAARVALAKAGGL
jgi:hypothetical protein